MSKSAVGVFLCLSFPFLLGAAPEKWNKFFTQGDQALREGRYDEAIGNYRLGAVSASESEIQKTWDDLGYAYLQKRSAKEAIAYFWRALQASPEDYDLHLYLAVAYVLDEQMDKAGEELQRIENDILFDDRWIKMNADLSIKNDFGDEVSKDCVARMNKERGVLVRRDSPHSATVYVDAFDERNEGALYFYQGFVEAGRNGTGRAEARFQSALKAGYEEKDVQFGRSHAPAEIPLKLHHRLKGHNNGLAWLLHGRFLTQLAQGQIIDGISTLHEALDIDEQSFEINHNIALMYFDLDDFIHAETFGARALWFKDNDAGGHELMGNIDFRQNAYGRALHEFQRILEIDPANPSGHLNLGSAYYMLADFSKAEVCWKKAIDLDRNGLELKNNAPPADEKLRYSIVTKKTPVAFLAHKSLGNLYAGQLLVEPAIAEFEAALELRPNDAPPYLSLGQLYQRKNDKDKAVYYLEKYLFLGGPQDVEARRILDALRKKLARPAASALPCAAG